ncbi:hypothetical protein [Thiohalospira halophila]|uniref:hypothetical protein n=1 Tax=Thiohalospira halophila TaxID=381300 RepID=UPI0011807C65|nr:hypothetical protein [Thiohalospira halophila]
MSKLWEQFKRWKDVVAAFVIGFMLLFSGSLLDWVVSDKKRQEVRSQKAILEKADPGLELYRSVSKVSSAAASDFMLGTFTGQTLEEPSACSLATVLTRGWTENEVQAGSGDELLKRYRKACAISLKLRDVTRPRLQAIAGNGVLPEVVYIFEVYDSLMDNEWEKVGPFFDEAVCQNFSAVAIDEGYGIKKCHPWAPKY